MAAEFGSQWEAGDDIGEILRREDAVKRWRIQSRSGATVVVDVNATEPGLASSCTDE
jgi:hypothetical protein